MANEPIEMIGVVAMSEGDIAGTLDLACTRCSWGTADLLASGYDGYLGVENHELVKQRAQDHDRTHQDLVQLPDDDWPHQHHFPILNDDGDIGDCECGMTFDEHEEEMNRWV